MNVCQVKGPRNAEGQTDWNFYNVYWCRGITTHVHRITADVCVGSYSWRNIARIFCCMYMYRGFYSLAHHTHTHTHTVCPRVCTCQRDKREWERERLRERERERERIYTKNWVLDKQYTFTSHKHIGHWATNGEEERIRRKCEHVSFRKIHTFISVICLWRYQFASN